MRSAAPSNTWLAAQSVTGSDNNEGSLSDNRRPSAKVSPIIAQIPYFRCFAKVFFAWPATTPLHLYHGERMLPNKHETLTHCWINAGPPSTTLAQHWSNNLSFLCFRGFSLSDRPIHCPNAWWLLLGQHLERRFSMELGRGTRQD